MQTSWFTKNTELKEFKRKIRAVPQLISCLDPPVKQKQGDYTSINPDDCSPDNLYREIYLLVGNDQMKDLIMYYHSVISDRTRNANLTKQIESAKKKLVYNTFCLVLKTIIDKLYAIQFFDQNDYDKALPMFQDFVENSKRFPGEDHRDTLSALHKIAYIHFMKREYDKALPLFQECLEKRKRVLGEDHPDTLITLYNVANTYENMKDYDKALPLFATCMEKRKRVLGEDHRDTIKTINDLAYTKYITKDYHNALPLFEECLEKRKRLLGEDHPDTLTSLNNVANTYANMGEYDTAFKLFQECLKKRKRVLGEDHPDTRKTSADIVKYEQIQKIQKEQGGGRRKKNQKYVGSTRHRRYSHGRRLNKLSASSSNIMKRKHKSARKLRYK